MRALLAGLGSPEKFTLTFGRQNPKCSALSDSAAQLVDIQQQLGGTPMTELLTALRENRRGKGLYVEPTDCQVMQIWEQADFVQHIIVPSLTHTPSKASLALDPKRSISRTICLKIQYAARIFSGAKAT